MARLFPWDFLEQFGYAPGSKSEATHYSTFGGSDWLLTVRGSTPYYWNELSGSWSKSSLDLDQMMLLGEKEPEFRCGPPKPIVKKVRVPMKQESSNYGYGRRNRYMGD